jgi:septum site-determining protein MinD
VGDLRASLDRLRRRVGPVVVDCPAGLRSDVGVPLVAATACLLVTHPREAALTAALRVRELAQALDAPLAGVVLNRSADVRTDSVAATLGAPVTRIPDSPRLASAQRAGVPVGDVAPESVPASRFETLADRLQSLRSSA